MDKYNIVMLKTASGSENGIDVKTFFKDKEYIVGEPLYKVFIDMAVCKLVENNPAVEKKVIDTEYEKKVVMKPYNKKGKK